MRCPAECGKWIVIVHDVFLDFLAANGLDFSNLPTFLVNYHLLRFPFCFPHVALFLCALVPLQGWGNPAPAGSEISDSKKPQTVIAPLDNPEVIRGGGYKMESVQVGAIDRKDLPEGTKSGIKFTSIAQPQGGKGDCTVAKTLEENFSMVGGWFYISPNSVIDSIGFQLMESGGEYFSLHFPADFSGWKWLEGRRSDFKAFNRKDRPDFDQILDGLVDRVSVVWFVKDSQETEVGVAGLVSISD